MTGANPDTGYNAGMEALLHTCVLAFVLYLYYTSLQEEKRYSNPGLAKRRKQIREEHDASEKKSNNSDLESAVMRSILLQMDRCATKQDDESLLYLKECLEHPRVEISTRASELLSSMNHPKALEFLLAYIQKLDQKIQKKEEVIETRKVQKRPAVSRKPFVRSRLSEAVIENQYEGIRNYLDSKEDEPEPLQLRVALLRCATDETAGSGIRHHAIHSLKAFDQLPPSNLIQQWLQDRDPLLKQAAMELIRHFQLTDLVPRLEVEIMNLNPSIALEAIYSLHDLGSMNSLPKLEILLNHKEVLVREAARFAVTNLRDRVKLGSYEH